MKIFPSATEAPKLTRKQTVAEYHKVRNEMKKQIKAEILMVPEDFKTKFIADNDVKL